MINLPTRIIGAIIAALVAVFICWAALHFWQKSRSQGAQSKVDHAQTGALSNSAADAINTVGNAASREQASDDLTRSNEKAIRNAEGSDAAVTPAARNAGLDGLCRRPAYIDSDRCKLRRATTPGMAVGG